MYPLTSLVLPITLAVASVGILLVLYFSRRVSRVGGGVVRNQAVEMECTVCHKQLVFSPSELTAISPAEIALVVRTHPGLVGKKLQEYVCPYCEASHCFVVDRRSIQWAAVNSYNPQAITANCMECNTAFIRPPWPKGQYDGRVHAVPQLKDTYGLVCSRCGARCCVACCRKVTPKDAADYKCPRCRRGPVNEFVHF